jgi:DNA repair protein RadD
LIIDEAHHSRARTYMRLVETYRGAVIVGLTATPCRSDGRGLGNIFEVLVECPSVADLTIAGYLVSARIFAPVRPNLSGISIARGDYIEARLADRMNTALLVGDIVEHWHRIGEGRPTVVFTVNVAHSVHVRNGFRRSGVLAEHVDGSTPLEERKTILDRFAAGGVDVICNCAVLTEGWDRPEASCLVLARSTRSLGLYRQMVGRVLRPALGIDVRFLRNKHGPCPICGGKDRFRFDDSDGSGSYYCNQCGPGPGLVLIRNLWGWDHKTACDKVDRAMARSW